jgi:hypothetical protein
MTLEQPTRKGTQIIKSTVDQQGRSEQLEQTDHANDKSAASSSNNMIIDERGDSSFLKVLNPIKV